MVTVTATFVYDYAHSTKISGSNFFRFEQVIVSLITWECHTTPRDGSNILPGKTRAQGQLGYVIARYATISVGSR